MPKYRKKPLVVEAEIYRPGMEDAFLEIFTGRIFSKDEAHKCKRNKVPVILTLEGPLRITEGDLIITGIRGEKYPCKTHIFDDTYELVEER